MDLYKNSVDNLDNVNGDKKDKSCKERMLISHNSKWKGLFDIWMLFLVGYSCFTTIFLYATFKHLTYLALHTPLLKAKFLKQSTLL